MGPLWRVDAFVRTDMTRSGWTSRKRYYDLRRDAVAAYDELVATAEAFEAHDQFDPQRTAGLQHVRLDRIQVAELSKTDLLLAALHGEGWHTKEDLERSWGRGA